LLGICGGWFEDVQQQKALTFAPCQVHGEGQRGLGTCDTWLQL